jgi:hypothetical protein
MPMDMVTPAGRRFVQFVGSVQLGSAEEVFTAIAAAVGDCVRRIPDGETGDRSGWISWQLDRLQKVEGLEEKSRRFVVAVANRPELGLKDGVRASDLKLGPLGFAEEAVKSYAVFADLRARGRIRDGVRFQVSIPTPLAVVYAFFVPDAVRPMWPVYEAAVRRELDEMCRAIPHRDLAIQWDIAIEIDRILEFPEIRKHYPIEELVAAIARVSDPIPREVELGLHLCYGDPGHKHIIEPKDTGLMVDLANQLVRAIRRPVTWFHMPVPRERDDDAYFAPLAGLSLAPETELYLGLVHLTDGVPGAKRRLAAAKRAVRDFGIATECGFGRRPPETIPALIALHGEIASLP